LSLFSVSQLCETSHRQIKICRSLWFNKTMRTNWGVLVKTTKPKSDNLLVITMSKSNLRRMSWCNKNSWMLTLFMKFRVCKPSSINKNYKLKILSNLWKQRFNNFNKRSTCYNWIVISSNQILVLKKDIKNFPQ
jgi:hypothetical protein